MSNNNANTTNQNAAAAPTTQVAANAAPVDLLSEAVASAATSAGTSTFSTDMQKLEDVLSKHRSNFVKRPLLDVATEAAVYGGVIALCLVGSFAVIRLLSGSSESSAN